jgi:hypothetical protein
MDNAQVTAPDGTWFLFGDWQGMTRLGLPGDKVKTDANLDRPHGDKPLVLRPEGLVWSAYATDIDPLTLKKIRPAEPGHYSPDPLGGPEMVVGSSGEVVTVRGAALRLEASGAELGLGGTEGRRETYGSNGYAVWPDGSLVACGNVDRRTQVALIVRAADGAARVAWCRPVARVENGAPEAFRAGGSTWLGDRDLPEGVGYLVEIRDDGTVVSEQHAAAVAGPWVLDGQVWWQPDEATVCVGARLGEPTQSFPLAGAHAGPGRLLGLAGRRLFLPWHGVTILDLAPAKKGKEEISRKHKAAEEPMYREAARLLRPIAAGMARRGIRVAWRGCTRSGKRLEPQGLISGRSDVVTYLLGAALPSGARARLARVGVTDVSFMGGAALDDVLAPRRLTTAADLRELVALLDAAGVSRAGVAHLQSVAEMAAARKLAFPLTPEAEDFAMAAALSGMRLETGGEIPPATAASFAAVAPLVGDYEALKKAGIDGTLTALFLVVAGHRRFGAEAVAPLLEALVRQGAHHANEVARALGQPVIPYVAPVVAEAPLTADELRLVALIEGALRGLGVDPEAARESRGWYRFTLDGYPFQGGLHDDVRVLGTLCATATDVDLKALGASLKQANRGLAGARFEEADGYLHARAACPREGASAAGLEAMIQACRAALATEAAQGLKTRYRTIG